MARAGGQEVPVGCLVDEHRGWVSVARVAAEGLGAGLVGVMGGCAGESCGEVGEARLMHGVPDSHVGGCEWAGAVVVGGGGVRVAYDDGVCQEPGSQGARCEGEAAVHKAQGVQEVLHFLPKWDVRE